MNVAKYFCFHFATFVVLILIGFTSASGQAKDRIIEYPVFPIGFIESVEGINPSGLKNVLEIVDVKVAGRSITIGQPFSAEEDWLKSLVFRMKNTSKRSITGARIHFGLPETKSDDKHFGFSFEYGKGLSTGIASDEQKIIKPNEEFELKFNEAQYQRYKKFFSERSNLSSFSKILIGVTMAKFEDELIWATRCLYSSNPSNSCH
jgi:hypothetical protein